MSLLPRWLTMARFGEAALSAATASLRAVRIVCTSPCTRLLRFASCPPCARSVSVDPRDVDHDDRSLGDGACAHGARYCGGLRQSAAQRRSQRDVRTRLGADQARGLGWRCAVLSSPSSAHLPGNPQLPALFHDFLGSPFARDLPAFRCGWLCAPRCAENLTRQPQHQSPQSARGRRWLGACGADLRAIARVAVRDVALTPALTSQLH